MERRFQHQLYVEVGFLHLFMFGMTFWHLITESQTIMVSEKKNRTSSAPRATGKFHYLFR